MFAFIVEEADGGEGVPGFSSRGVMWPLVGADLERIESMRGAAQHIANESRKPMKIVKFTAMEQIGEINPQ